MKEKLPNKPNLRVIEGGKKELQEPLRRKVESPQTAKLAAVRKLSPSLDLYLSHRPADREDRMRLLEKINDELWKLPAGGIEPKKLGWTRNIDKLGEQPRSVHFITWRDTTDEQLAWQEQEMMEYANAVGEKLLSVRPETY